MTSLRKQKCVEHSTTLSGGERKVWCDECEDYYWIPRFPFVKPFSLQIIQSDIDTGTVSSSVQCPTAIAWKRKVLQELYRKELDEEGNFLGDPSQWSKMPNVNVEVQGDFIIWTYGSDTWHIYLSEDLRNWIVTYDYSDPDRGPSVGPAVFTFYAYLVRHEWEL